MPSKPRKNPKSFRLLGKNEPKFPDHPSPGILDTFPNKSAKRDYWIQFDCPEFTSMCPVTGQPDFGVIRIRYIPDSVCIETKSLKYYLAAFRNTRSFNEEIANRILEDLVSVCQPRKMIIEASFASRGGIKVSVEASFPD